MHKLTQDFILAVVKGASNFGYKEQEDGAQLYGKVPHIAPLAWFHKIYANLREEELGELSKLLPNEIPIVYKDFLVNVNNGMSLFSDSLNLYGYRKSFNRTSNLFSPFDLVSPNKEERPKDAKSNHFFFGGYNWDGSLLYLDSLSLNVNRCDVDTVKSLNAWENFDAFILSEIKRLRGLFDECGKILDIDNPTIPI